MKVLLHLVFVTLSAVVVCSGQSDNEMGRMISWLSSDNQLLDCIYKLNDNCIESYARGPLQNFFFSDVIRINQYVSLERLGEAREDDKSEYWNNLWSFTGITDTIEKFMKDHALKMNVGNLAVRLFESRSQPDYLELTIDTVPRNVKDDVGTGKSRRMYRVVIPLIMGFKITGMIIFGILATKLFLIKATIFSNTALLISGFIVLKKLYDHGVNMLNTQHHNYLYSHQSIPNYYQDSLGAGTSAYGYYNNNFEGLGAYSGPYSAPSADVSTDTGSSATTAALSEIPADLQGHYANQALALAALNKTLLYRPQTSPKRRWSVRWNGQN